MLGKPAENLFHRRVDNTKESLPYKEEIDKTAKERIVREILLNIHTITYRFHDKVVDEENHFLALLYREFPTAVLVSKNERENIDSILRSFSTKELLSAIELYIKTKIWSYNEQGTGQDFDIIEVMDSINSIFRIEKLGYELVQSTLDDVPFMIIPFKSKYLHNETIVKTVVLLSEEGFQGALEEFEKALQKLRVDDYPDTCVLATRAYESTLKTIIEKKGQSYSPETDKIPQLVEKVRSIGIIPPQVQTNFDSFWGVLKTGPNNIRNLEGVAHGQGQKIQAPEKAFAEFVIHIAGSYIVFLIERYKETK
jgi:hypothetical protein